MGRVRINLWLVLTTLMVFTLATFALTAVIQHLMSSEKPVTAVAYRRGWYFNVEVETSRKITIVRVVATVPIVGEIVCSSSTPFPLTVESKASFVIFMPQYSNAPGLRLHLVLLGGEKVEVVVKD